jgi:hypothetical protein
MQQQLAKTEARQFITFSIMLMISSVAITRKQGEMYQLTSPKNSAHN